MHEVKNKRRGGLVGRFFPTVDHRIVFENDTGTDFVNARYLHPSKQDYGF